MESERIYRINNSKRWKSFGIFGILLVLVVCTLNFGLEQTPLDSEELAEIKTVLWSITGVLVVFCLALFISIWHSSKNYFKVSAMGIEDKMTRWGFGLIPWNDIKELKYSEINNEKHLFIFVKDPKVYLKKPNKFLTSFHMNFNQEKFQTPIVINAEFIKTDLEEFKNYLDDCFSRYR